MATNKLSFLSIIWILGFFMLVGYGIAIVKIYFIPTNEVQFTAPQKPVHQELEDLP